MSRNLARSRTVGRQSSSQTPIDRLEQQRISKENTRREQIAKKEAFDNYISELEAEGYIQKSATKWEKQIVGKKRAGRTTYKKTEIANINPNTLEVKKEVIEKKSRKKKSKKKTTTKTDNRIL